MLASVPLGLTQAAVWPYGTKSIRSPDGLTHGKELLYKSDVVLF